MRIWNSLVLELKTLISFKGKLDVFVKMVPVMPMEYAWLCRRWRYSVLWHFYFHPFLLDVGWEKNFKSMQAGQIFTVQLQGSKGAPLMHLTVGTETWPFSSAELLWGKLSKTKFSTSEKSYLFLPTLYFSYLFLSVLYFVPKGKKPGTYSLGRKDKREKLYCFGNDLFDMLQATDGFISIKCKD